MNKYFHSTRAIELCQRTSTLYSTRADVWCQRTSTPFSTRADDWCQGTSTPFSTRASCFVPKNKYSLQYKGNSAAGPGTSIIQYKGISAVDSTAQLPTAATWQAGWPPFTLGSSFDWFSSRVVTITSLFSSSELEVDAESGPPQYRPVRWSQS